MTEGKLIDVARDKTEESVLSVFRRSDVKTKNSMIDKLKRMVSRKT